MTAAELAAATKQFDTPIKFEDTRPLSPEQQRREARARKGPVVSMRVYNGKVRTIKVKLDELLLERFDEFAKRNNMTRDEFIERSLRSVVAFVD